MKKLMKSLTLLLLLAGTSAMAADGGVVSLDLRTEREVTVTGEDGNQSTALEPVTRAAPGEELIFTIRYVNSGTEDAENVVLTYPVPEDLAYMDGSAVGAGADFEVSVDGGATWGSPGELTVIGEDGQPRPATSDDYTHLHWVLRDAVPADGEGFVRFRARVR